MGSSFIHLIRTDSNEFFLMAEEYSVVYMYHSFLIHSCADGHLGCFHVLAMINSAAMNIGVHVSLSDLFPWCVCPAVVLLGRMAVLFPVFKEISTLFSVAFWSLFMKEAEECFGKSVKSGRRITHHRLCPTTLPASWPWVSHWIPVSPPTLKV